MKRPDFRAWRQSGIRAIDPVVPIAVTPPIPHALWGESAYRHQADHIMLEVLHAPEGLIVVIVCASCGGRYERLIELRAVFHSFAWQRRRALLETARATSKGFIDKHRLCKEQPATYTIPAEVAEAWAVLIDEARAQLRVQHHITSTVAYLTAEGEAFGFKADDLPPTVDEESTAARRRIIAERHWAMRELAIARKTHYVAVFAVGEAWVAAIERDEYERRAAFHPSIDPDRREFAVLSVMTPTFGKVGLSEITRRGNVPDRGPGAFSDRVDLLPMAERQGLLDGAMARVENEPDL